MHDVSFLHMAITFSMCNVAREAFATYRIDVAAWSWTSNIPFIVK